MEKGLVHIYCGDGKGKTTAALGLALRAEGRGKKVLLARFLKTDDSGEVAALKNIPGITLIPCERTFGFLSHMTEEEKREAKDWYGKVLEKTLVLAAPYFLYGNNSEGGSFPHGFHHGGSFGCPSYVKIHVKIYLQASLTLIFT